MPAQAESVVDRIKRSNFQSASSIDLIALGFARREQDISEPMALGMFQHYQGVAPFKGLSIHDIHRFTGLEEFESLRCKALIELGRRSGQTNDPPGFEIDKPETVVARLEHLRREKKEHFCVVLLDAKNQHLHTAVIHIGTLTMSVVGPREVFREAIREGASSIIVAHNHPSGDPTPSPEDIQVTQKLQEIGQMLDIPLLDHIIMGNPGTESFRRLGLIK